MALDLEYLKSAVFPSDYPKANRPEVAVAGRSNAGKSSFLNAISNKLVAKVSQEPGKTRLLNFFDVGKSYRLVDMPGYGFAKRSGEEVKSWAEMIENYLSVRQPLAGLILVMDIKRDWTREEELLADFMWNRNLPFCIIATRADQLTPKEIENRLNILQTQSGQDAVFAVSTVKKTGTAAVEDYIYKNWIKNFKVPKPEFPGHD